VSRILILLLLLVSQSVFSQIKINSDNNLTGSFNTTKAGDQPSMVINGNNRVYLNKFYFDVNPFYQVSQTNHKLTANELLIRDDIGFNDSIISLFLVHQYNSSFIRGISSDNWFGLGISKNIISNKNIVFNLSACIENEYRRYTDVYIERILRESYRAKIKLNYETISLSFEYYFQPNVNDLKDINIFGSTTLSLFNNKSINFIIQNTYNYISTDKIKTIQSTSIGIKIKTKYER